MFLISSLDEEKKSALQVDQLVKESADKFQALARENQVTVTLDLENAFLVTNGILLSSIINNLLSNGIKYKKAGGSVQVESTFGQGSTFTVTLPK